MSNSATIEQPFIDPMLEDDDDDMEEDEISTKLGGNVSYDDVLNKLQTPEMQAIKASIPGLSWPKMIRLMEYGDLSEEHVCTLLGGKISVEQVIEQRKKFNADDAWNIGEYGTYITFFKRAMSKRRVTTNAEGKPVQGTKIKDMWMSVTEVPVSQTDLIEKFGVSIHILKQYKRFLKPEWFPKGYQIQRIVAKSGEPHYFLQKVVD